ncbi:MULTISPECIES: exonuclease SbcCD subunit D C-terminal domain-containing protein [unclassified Psychrobacter]|uniref:exonuclease SbcCD subunit D C-terminal domain-containing protein n=1 Tax=unclassified Psychrobacter TaxID=196806 RepID=UPI0018F46C3D|nr:MULTISPECIES: exonuclease SbcCD subunit D C-terminal domain-containing protein [unclassified Psychrobacter]
MSTAAPTLNKPLTVLHTSDWHLGRRLYGQMRYEEFAAFLAWLQDTMHAQQVDILIVAGDVFDTMTPSNRAQALYYEFLAAVAKSTCQHIVIVAGNHDSPSFLDAPSQFLRALNVHVIGTACDDASDEVLVLDNANGQPTAIVAAVPYLRDRDVRGSSAGESMDTKDANVVKGIQTHYDRVAAIAKDKQAALLASNLNYVPIIATGHLFAAGGKTTEDDGVRELYVGNLGKVTADTFDDSFDYVALGHLHVPQRVGGCEHIRYSGSPIAMGFGEARQQKQVLLVQFGDDIPPIDMNIQSAQSAPASTAPTEPAPEAQTPTSTPQNTQASFTDDLFGFDMFDDDEEETIVEQTKPIAEAVATEPQTTRKNGTQMLITPLAVPTFQPLAQITGDIDHITRTIQALPAQQVYWLEVIYDGDEVVTDLREQIQALVAKLPHEVLKIKNNQRYEKVLNQQQGNETLQDLNEMEVFERCLIVHDVADSQRPTLRDAYAEIVHHLHHDDKYAE